MASVKKRFKMKLDGMERSMVRMLRQYVAEGDVDPKRDWMGVALVMVSYNPENNVDAGKDGNYVRRSFVPASCWFSDAMDGSLPETVVEKALATMMGYAAQTYSEEADARLKALGTDPGTMVFGFGDTREESEAQFDSALAAKEGTLQ